MRHHSGTIDPTEVQSWRLTGIFHKQPHCRLPVFVKFQGRLCDTQITSNLRLADPASFYVCTARRGDTHAANLDVRPSLAKGAVNSPNANCSNKNLQDTDTKNPKGKHGSRFLGREIALLFLFAISGLWIGNHTLQKMWKSRAISRGLTYAVPGITALSADA